MEQIDENKGKVSKIKNKKKDVIVVEKSKEKVINTESKENEENTKSSDKSSEINQEVIENVESNESNNSLINKLIFRIQLLLSMTNKIDLKLLNVFAQFLSQDHLKGILEERDCREICGNMLCGNKLSKNKMQKYFYNSSTKDFNKDNLLDFFCDVKCFQKFKDISMISQKFDYFRLLNLENIYFFTVLNQYYPQNKYLEEISMLANSIISKEKKCKENPEMFLLFKQKADIFFKNKEESPSSEESAADKKEQLNVKPIEISK